MNLKVNYIEHALNLEADTILAIEIENVTLFYRFVKDIYSINSDNPTNELYFYDKNNIEININGRVGIYVNFFDFDFNIKQNLNILNKKIINFLSDENKNEILNNFKKSSKSFLKFLKQFDLEITYKENINIEDIVKMFKLSINQKDNLLDNLLLLIDLISFLNINDCLFMINLKQYLTKEEINEFYKYAIYNNVSIIMIDNKCYGIKNDYENKLIIDEHLEEIVL